MERSKKITVSVSALKEDVKLKEPFLSISYFATFLKIKRRTYNITDKPGCGKLRPKLYVKVKDGERGYDLNYPRTIRLILTKVLLHTVLSLSGTVYNVSEIELQFARETLDSFRECQRLILSSLEREPNWKDVYFMIDVRTFWKDMKTDLEKISRALCGVQKFLDTTFLDILVDIENLWRKYG